MNRLLSRAHGSMIGKGLRLDSLLQLVQCISTYLDRRPLLVQRDGERPHIGVLTGEIEGLLLEFGKSSIARPGGGKIAAARSEKNRELLQIRTDSLVFVRHPRLEFVHPVIVLLEDVRGE